MRLRRFAPLMGGALLFAMLACTASQPTLTDDQRAADLPGFLLGFWQGFIAPVAFVVSLFADSVRIYAFPNSGLWYDFGFMLGISGFSGGIFAGSRKKG
jgi:hypothetical protein